MKIQLTREQLQTIASLSVFAARGDTAKWVPVLSETRITLDTIAGTLTAVEKVGGNWRARTIG
jgi:hypothetical protein